MPPALRIKRYLICENDKIYNGATMKEMNDLYNQISSGFEESLKDRTPDEIAYDDAVINELKKEEILIRH